jgi:ADP-ribose pyrophosphatase YjhB (NUDIX family)
MRWQVHGTHPAYQSPWVEVWLDDVELPNGERIEHHVLKFPRPSVTAVVVDDQDRTLLIWRHRYITDTWGWEVPAGWAEAGEDLTDTARREVEEETGYRPGTVRRMTAYDAIAGISTMRFTSFVATDAVRIGEPRDLVEASRVEWIPLSDVPKLADSGQISDGPSLTALSYYLAVHRPLAR